MNSVFQWVMPIQSLKSAVISFATNILSMFYKLVLLGYPIFFIPFYKEDNIYNFTSLQSTHI